jgi:hypothetical protein
MNQKDSNPRGRPITNKIERIPATAEDIAKAIFRAADEVDKKAKPTKRKKPKPN